MADADWKIPSSLRPNPAELGYDLNEACSAVVALSASVPEDALTAGVLGTERVGHAVQIREDGVVLTIGYLITEAEQVTLETWEGRTADAHVLGYDQASGFGLLQALDPLGVAALPLGDSAAEPVGESLVMAGVGGPARALDTRLIGREQFAGYWEYLIEGALFTAPAYPLWSGAALIDPQGALIGIGSLHLEQRAPDGQVRPANMSVPVDLLKPIFDDLLRGRPAGEDRPWLGVFAVETGMGVAVTGISERSPASRAGLRQGDVILAVDDEPTPDLPSFYRRMWSVGPAGATIPLRLRRGADVFDVEVRSASRRNLLRKPRYH